MVGAAVVAVGMIMSAVATSINMIVATLGFVVGIGLGMLFLPSVVIVGYYFERRRALASGISSAGAGVGVLIMAPLAALLLQHYDWRNALVLLAGLLLNSMIAGALLRPINIGSLTRTSSVDTDSECIDVGSKPNQEKSKPMPSVSHTLLKAALMNSTSGNQPCKSEATKSSESVANGNRLQRHSVSSDCNRTRCISSSETVQNYKKLEDKSDCRKCRGDKSNMHKSKFSTELEDRNYFSNYEINKDSNTQEYILNKHHCKSKHHQTRNSPLLQRKDIFYSGSITNLTQYRSQPDMEHYIASVTIPEREITSDEKCCGCIPRSYLSTTQRMLDFSLFTNVALLVIAAANALWQAGYMIPLLFVTDYGIAQGMDVQVSSLFVGVFGISTIFGRALGGAIGNLPRINPLIVVLVAQCIAGIASIAVPFCDNPALVMCCMATIGFMLGPITPLTTVLLVDYLGLNSLTNAVGLVSLSKGILCFFGAPIAGALLDATRSYIAPFVFAGILYICCGLLHVLLPIVGKPQS